jgi:hypothetical protein
VGTDEKVREFAEKIDEYYRLELTGNWDTWLEGMIALITVHDSERSAATLRTAVYKLGEYEMGDDWAEGQRFIEKLRAVLLSLIPAEVQKQEAEREARLVADAVLVEKVLQAQQASVRLPLFTQANWQHPHMSIPHQEEAVGGADALAGAARLVAEVVGPLRKALERISEKTCRCYNSVDPNWHSQWCAVYIARTALARDRSMGK